jgi:hypothetical protein
MIARIVYYAIRAGAYAWISVGLLSGTLFAGETPYEQQVLAAQEKERAQEQGQVREQKAFLKKVEQAEHHNEPAAHQTVTAETKPHEFTPVKTVTPHEQQPEIHAPIHGETPTHGITFSAPHVTTNNLPHETLSKPTPPSPEDMPAEEEIVVAADGTPEGIDTIDLKDPQGNWLYKRIWWMKAEAKYEKIRLAAEAVFDSRMQFFKDRTVLDRTIVDPFYSAIGLAQGELKEVLAELTFKVEKEHDKHTGKLSAEEQSFLEILQQQKSLLAQISKDAEVVIELDRAVDEVMMKIEEQIDRVRNYERQAWDLFKEVAEVLNDKKAREIFYQIDAIGKDIDLIHTYISQTVAQYFAKTVDNIKEHTQRLESEIEEFRLKGVDLKREAEEMINPTRGKKEAALSHEEDDEDAQESEGFIASYIISPIKSFFSMLWDLISWPVRKVMGWDGQDDEDDEDSMPARQPLQEIVPPVDEKAGMKFPERSPFVPTAAPSRPAEQEVVSPVQEEGAIEREPLAEVHPA